MHIQVVEVVAQATYSQPAEATVDSWDIMVYMDKPYTHQVVRVEHLAWLYQDFPNWLQAVKVATYKDQSQVNSSLNGHQMPISFRTLVAEIDSISAPSSTFSIL